MSMHEAATSSGLLTADTVIAARPARLLGLQVLADGTNAATVTIYDNATAGSGKELCKVIVDATLTAQDATLPLMGVCANQGLYADVTGTGAAFIVHYSLGN